MKKEDKWILTILMIVWGLTPVLSGFIASYPSKERIETERAHREWRRGVMESREIMMDFFMKEMRASSNTPEVTPVHIHLPQALLPAPQVMEASYRAPERERNVNITTYPDVTRIIHEYPKEPLKEIMGDKVVN